MHYFISKRSFAALFILAIIIVVPTHVTHAFFERQTIQNGTWEDPTTWAGLITESRDIDVDATHNMYVAAPDLNGVVKLDSSGAFVSLITTGTLNAPQGVGLDASGNIYIADTSNNRIVKLNPAGDTVLATFTASGTLSSPFDVAVATNGDIYIADEGNNRIVHLDASGAIIAALSDNGGLLHPEGVAVDASGNIYIADSEHQRVAILNSSGVETNSLSASGAPRHVAVDGSGNIYVPDTNSNDVIEFDPSGATLATLTAGGNFSNPSGIAIDSDGNLYLTNEDSYDIIKLDSSDTLLGDFTGAEVPATSDDVTVNHDVTLTSSEAVHNLNLSCGSIDLAGHTLSVTGHLTIQCSRTLTLTGTLAAGSVEIEPSAGLDLNGQTLIVTSTNLANRGVFSADGGTIEFAGGATQIVSGIDTFYNLTDTTAGSHLVFPSGQTTTVEGALNLGGSSNNLLRVTGGAVSGFSDPKGLALDASGNIYVADDFHRRIVVLNPDGTTKAIYNGDDISSLPGSPTSGFGDVPGVFGIVVAPSGDIYVMDVDNNRLVVLNPDGSAKAVYTGSDLSTLPGSPANGFDLPKTVALDSAGNVYLGDGYNNNRIVVLNPDLTPKAVYTGSDISSLPGSPTPGFVDPAGLVVAPNGDIYISDTFGNRIVVLNPDGSAKAVYRGSDISSLPGSPTNGFGNPKGLALDASGNLYIADDFNGRVVVLNPNGSAKAVYDGDGISSLPGSPANGFCSSDVPESCPYPGPAGVALDAEGNIYVSDVGAERIVKLDSSGTPLNVFDANDAAAITLPWSIDPQGSVLASYLSVDESTNVAEAAIDCTNGCVDEGGNVNWTFPAAAVVHHSSGGGGGCGNGFVWDARTLSCDPTLAIASSVGATTTPAVATSTPGMLLWPRDLYLGLQGEDVLQLQKYLNSHGSPLAESGVGSPGDETIYFGSRTKNALIKFQQMHSIVPAAGYFGPITRGVIASLGN